MKYIKKNLISFVIGIVLFGSIGVYAIVTFQSKDVSYENKSSGLSSNNVQGAIDELYEECTKVPTSGGTILDNEEIKTSGDGLYADEYEKGRYIYKGKNVNNYITFNNETWRIISIEPDETIKIMKPEGIGDIAWDTSNSNNWAKPATLNTYLNGSYLTSTLNATAQSQIVSKDWSIGAVTYENNDLAGQINDENSKAWNGKVALPTLSEFFRTILNANCKTFYQYNNNYDSCINNTWMYNSNINYWWTLTAEDNNSYRVYDMLSIHNIGHDSSGVPNIVRPAVYLSSEIKITGGDGSQNNPYTIG